MNTQVNYFLLRLKWYHIIFLLLWGVFCYLKAINGGDFDVYIDAAKKLSQGENIYAPPFAKGLQYYYSVAFALGLILFIKVPILGKFLWLMFSSWCIYRTWKIAEFFLSPKKALGTTSYYIWMALCVFISIRFILYNFSTLQLTIFLLWASLESIYQCYKNKQLRAGFILGIAINIKLLPLVLLPYLFYRQYYKALGMAFITIGLLLYLPSLFIGLEQNFFLLGEWWNTINPTSQENSLKGNKLMHSLAAVVPAYFMVPIDGFDGIRQITNFQESTVKFLINLIRTMLIGGTLFFLKWPPFIREHSKHKVWWEVSYIFLIIPLIFPHQQKYSFWFIIPALMYILLVINKKNINTFAFSLFIILLILISPIIGRDIIGKNLYDLFQYYKILSIVTISFIPLLISFPPNKLSSNL